MSSDDQRFGRPATARGARGQDIIAKLSRAIRPKPPGPSLPTAEDFEKLLNRFEREYTIAFHSWVWRTTWVEINQLAERLFLDKCDLREFYACDYAVELILARNIPGVDEKIRDCMVGAGPLRTLESIAAQYVATWDKPNNVAYNTLCNLETLINAYSPPNTTRLQLLERTMEVLRQAGADLNEDHPVVRDWRQTLHRERAERYARDKERGGKASGAVTPQEGSER